jgi:hypothetical protein
MFLWQPSMTGSFSLWLLAVPVLVSYGQGLRYLAVARSYQSLGSQLVTFALPLLAVLWVFTGAPGRALVCDGYLPQGRLGHESERRRGHARNCVEGPLSVAAVVRGRAEARP